MTQKMQMLVIIKKTQTHIHEQKSKHSPVAPVHTLANQIQRRIKCVVLINQRLPYTQNNSKYQSLKDKPIKAGDSWVNKFFNL